MGGWSLFAGSPYSTGLPFCLPFCLPESGCHPDDPESCCLLPDDPESSFLPSIVANFQTIRAKRGKNKFLFGVLWCFLGIFGDRSGQNLNIFLKVRKEGGVLRWSAACLHSAHLYRLSRLRTCRMVGSGPFVVRSLVFVRSPALLSVRCLRIWLYFAF